MGLDIATLGDRERAVLDRLPEVTVSGGRARRVDAPDVLADHPFLAALAAGGTTPPGVEGVDRAELRELVRRGLIVERDGCFYAPTTIAAVSRTMARMLAEQPAGVTVSEFRDAVGTTRKHALPLLAELDARGVTRRRGDVRIAGPRLPDVPAG
jgi:selenocysteine-specific elongation factor